MTPIRLHYSLILDVSGCPDPKRAVKRFLETAEFADVEKSVERVRGKYVVRYTIDGPQTLTELRRTLKYMPKTLFSEATPASILNLNQRPGEFNIELNVHLPVYGLEEQ